MSDALPSGRERLLHERERHQAALDTEQAMADLDQAITDRQEAIAAREQARVEADQQRLDRELGPGGPAGATVAAQVEGRFRQARLASAQAHRDAHQEQIDLAQTGHVRRQDLLDEEQDALLRPVAETPQATSQELASAEDDRARAAEHRAAGARHRAVEAARRADAAEARLRARDN